MKKNNFTIGDLVKIINEEHVWCGELAIIRQIKPNFSRLEIRGELIWFHNDWLKLDESEY